MSTDDRFRHDDHGRQRGLRWERLGLPSPADDPHDVTTIVSGVAANGQGAL